jgi:YD repeat-containing protein
MKPFIALPRRPAVTSHLCFGLFAIVVVLVACWPARAEPYARRSCLPDSGAPSALRQLKGLRVNLGDSCPPDHTDGMLQNWVTADFLPGFANVHRIRIKVKIKAPLEQVDMNETTVTAHGSLVWKGTFYTPPPGTSACAMAAEIFVTKDLFVGGCDDVPFSLSMHAGGSQYLGAYAEITEVYYLESLCGRSCLGGAPSGSETGAFCNRYRESARNGSVDWSLPFGTPSGNLALPAPRGRFHLYSSLPSTNLCRPEGLAYLKWPGSDVEVIRSPLGGRPLRQIKGADGLADITVDPTNAFKYHIRLYAASNVTVKLADGLWAKTNQPYASFTLANPAGSTNDQNRLVIDSMRGQSTSTYTYSFGTNVASPTYQAWTLCGPAGLFGDCHTTWLTNGGSARIVCSDVLCTNAPVAGSREIRKYAILPWGEPISEHTLVGTNVPITSTWEYWTNATDAGYGQPRKIVGPFGDWTTFEYDASGRLWRQLAAFGNQSCTNNASLCRSTILDYTTLVGSGDAGAEPNTPRTTIEYVLGSEVRRSYLVLLPGERREIRCRTPGAAWNDPANLVTVTRHYLTGIFSSQLQSVKRPDGILQLHEYSTNSLFRTETVSIGAATAGDTAVTNGTSTVTVIDKAGRTLSRTDVDIATGTVLARETYEDFDPDGRPGRVTYLDGTHTETTPGCCGPESTRDRDGTLTTYAYDELRRLLAESRHGIMTLYARDAAGRVLSRARIGTDASPMVLERNVYDLAGNLVRQTNAVGQVTTFSESFDSEGRVVRTTTYPDQGTRIETYCKDGRLWSLTGSAVHPVRYEYGVESEGGVPRERTRSIRLDANNLDTDEWTKVFRDALGNDYLTTYIDGATERSYFDSAGRLERRVDADGVATIYRYDSRGDLEFTALDLNSNAALDLGIDRVVRTSHVLATNHQGVAVRRTLTSVWPTDDSTNASVATTTESSLDGLRTWSIVHGLQNITNATWTAYAADGWRHVTNSGPDGTATVTDFRYGRLESSTRLDATPNRTQISRTTFAYDPHGRLSESTDARNGTTTYAYDSADRVVSVSTPLPGGGQPAQTTSTQYDLNGRVHIVTHPDGTASTNTYFPTGLLATSQGSRTFPVSYTYDRQGRLATLTTWTNRASASNPAVTTWTYHPSRGWLTAKTYPGDTVGPTFTYTTGGRLKTRTWARSAAVGSPIVTTWKYGFDDAATGNQHSDPVEVSYNDGRTPALATAYDRLGRVRSLTTGGTNVLVRTLDPAGLVLGEGYTAGPLSGIYLTNTFDARGRRYTLAPRSGAAALGQTVTQSYDTAGRLQSFHDGTYSATYTYLPNSPLWESLEFQGSAVAATTTRSFDYLDRLVSISTQPGDPGSTPPLVFAYAYNAANQRVSRTDPDGSFWTFGYDSSPKSPMPSISGTLARPSPDSSSSTSSTTSAIAASPARAATPPAPACGPPAGPPTRSTRSSAAPSPPPSTSPAWPMPTPRSRSTPRPLPARGPTIGKNCPSPTPRTRLSPPSPSPPPSPPSPPRPIAPSSPHPRTRRSPTTPTAT